jgi:phosphosulfolactate synthase (CoM biosynthesis protein A)
LFLGGVLPEKGYSVAVEEYLGSCQYLGYSMILEQSHLGLEKVEPVKGLA